MASVPVSLKPSGAFPFITRAHQVEKVKPAVAYWCYYWAVQQIVTKGLHNTDDESKKYTGSLMDKLETAKNEHSELDAITDEVAAKAYLEQFGLEVFDRADNAIRNNKASKQTADTFQAAYTFLEVLNIWPPLELEIAAKIKFAKYHALRIAKAIKNGEDPNLSNPSQDTVLGTDAPSLDPADPEVEALGGLSDQHRGSQPSVEDIQGINSQDPANAARTSSLQHALSVGTVPTASVETDPNIAVSQGAPGEIAAEQFYKQTSAGDVSPLAPSSHGRANSDGGGYFPRVSQPPPGPPSTSSQSPSVPPNINAYAGRPESPNMGPPISPIQPSPPQSYTHGAAYYSSHAPAPAAPNYAMPNNTGNLDGDQYQANKPGYFTQPSPQQTEWSNASHANRPPAPQPLPTQPPALAPPATQSVAYIADDEAVAKAQKHARWAISALNFEDVKTAVQELRSALETLGAR